MAVIPYSLLLPPVIIGTLVSFYLYPPAIISQETKTTYCYPYIYTLNSEVPNARCFSVGGRGKRFIGVLNETVVGGGKVVDWKEKEEGKKEGEVVVIPGLWDGHAHLLHLGEMLEGVKLYGMGSVEAVRTSIEMHLIARATLGTKENWLRGFGWDQSLLFPDENTPHMPTSNDLSSPLLCDKYIMLDRVDGHCLWVSAAVIKLLPNPLPTNIPGGEILGNGSVFCDNAMDMVYDVYPDKVLGRRKVITRAEMAMKELNKVGVVGVHDAGMRKWEVEGLRWMAGMGISSVRLNIMVECETRNTYCGGEGESGVRNIMGRTEDGMVSVYGVKIYADGALGSWGAALLSPYSDKPETSGTMLINSTALQDVITEWYNAGYQVSTHSIGDLANHLTVQVYKDLLSTSPYTPPYTSPNHARRLRIEHAQIIAPEDQELIKSLGIIPSIQPTHATSDSSYAEIRLGKDRVQHNAYKMRSLFDCGLNVVLGSDFPVESHDPRNGIYAAVTRKNPYTVEEAGWHEEEIITVHQALEGFIKNPAYAMWAEGETGEISVGKWADWVVLGYGDEALGAKFWEEGWVEKGGDVRRLKVLETWVGGRKVYDASAEERGEESIFESLGKVKGWDVMGWVQRVFGGSGI
ncbi:amidohydrolase family-domain-containing protein [Tirmania nivea]|nr:amidohydrolase family-domain-containing protein [Tirmania nivea]